MFRVSLGEGNPLKPSGNVRICRVPAKMQTVESDGKEKGETGNLAFHRGLYKVTSSHYKVFFKILMAIAAAVEEARAEATNNSGSSCSSSPSP